MSKSSKKVSVGGALDWRALDLSESVRGVEIPVEDTYLQGSISLSQILLWSPVTRSFELQRIPTVFTGIDGMANTDNPWTPAAGKRFRLLGGALTISKEAACAGALRISLRDGAGGAYIHHWRISSAALVATGNVVYLPFQFPPNGYLSAAANNICVCEFSAALTAGLASISLWGTEE